MAVPISNPRPSLHSNSTADPRSKASRERRLKALRQAGLSKSHISPPTTMRLTLARGGRYAKLTNEGSAVIPHDRKPRSKITKYTAASRSRLFQGINKVWRKKAPPSLSMITLTYPGQYAADARRWHRDIDAFNKAFVRRYPKAFYFWKLEPQKRGAPHFHLLVWSFGGRDTKWLSSTWYGIVGSGDVRHLRAGTNWERVRGKEEITAYAAKYVGKMPDGPAWETPGRFWAVVNRKEMPVCEISLEVDEWEFVRMRRLMRRQMGQKNGYHLAGGSRSGCWIAWSEEEVRRVFAYLQDLRRFLLGYPIELRP